MGIMIRVRSRLWPRIILAMSWAMPRPNRNSILTASVMNSTVRPKACLKTESCSREM